VASERESAIQRMEHPVPAWNAHRARTFAARIHWDDLKTYLVVAESGSFRAAAGETGIAVNTLRRHVERLEREAGVTLLRRDIHGVSATDSGVALLEVAREMRSTAFHDPGDDRSADVLIQPGEIRIGCTETLGSVWLTPRLMALHAKLPNLTISLQQTYDAGGDRSREVDIGLTFHEPQNPALVRSRIAALHFMLFASQDYVRRYGQPTSFSDLKENHRFIEQAAAGVNSGLLDYFVGTERPKSFLPFRSNSAMSVYWAVINGAGIGAFPTYARALSKELIPLALPLRLRFDMWLYYHEAARHSPAVRATVDWIKAAFDARKYPWFGDDFVHPDDFPGADRSASVVQLFEGLAQRVGSGEEQ
jgi:DNA-binding transcriptional LysR family regulator